MGYTFKDVDGKKTRNYFLICDGCGIEVDVYGQYGVTPYMKNNNWVKLFNNIYITGDDSWRVKELCSTCACKERWNIPSLRSDFK